MTYEEYLLVHLMEEASEVIKACSKALRFGLDHFNEKEGCVNRENVRRELMNTNLQAQKCVDYGLIVPTGNHDEIQEALAKGERMLALSKQLGRVTD